MAAADFSRRLRVLLSKARRDILKAKSNRLSPHNRRIYAAPAWSQELRGHLPARPQGRRLVSGSCSSARGFAPRFFQHRPCGPCLAVRSKSLRPGSSEDFHLQVVPMLGTQKAAGREPAVIGHLLTARGLKAPAIADADNQRVEIQVGHQRPGGGLSNLGAELNLLHIEIDHTGLAHRNIEAGLKC